MGEHADDIINGDVDEFTGEWIGNGKGFPRSYKEMTDQKNKNKEQMLIANTERVRNILTKVGIEIVKEAPIQYGYTFKTKSKAVICVYTSKIVLQGQPDEQIKKLLKK